MSTMIIKAFIRFLVCYHILYELTYLDLEIVRFSGDTVGLQHTEIEIVSRKDWKS